MKKTTADNAASKRGRSMKHVKTCESCRYFVLKMYQSNGKCELECKCSHPDLDNLNTNPKFSCEKWMKIDPTIEV